MSPRSSLSELFRSSFDSSGLELRSYADFQNSATSNKTKEEERQRLRFSDTESRDETPSKSLWSPWPLRRTTLAVFIACLVLIIVAIGVLYNYSEHHSGLTSVNSDHQYYWTYGPTAVFTIMLVIWHRVDYRLRQLEPWRQLAGKGATPSQSLLLDYISPPLPQCMYISLRHRHYIVTTSILVGLMFRALIVLSTGLLSVQPSVSSTSHGLVVLESFGGNRLDSEDTTTEQVFYTTAGIQRFNFPYPAWTNDQYAVTSFEPAFETTSSSNLTGLVSAFSADLGPCETGTVTWPVNANASNMNPGYWFHTPSYTCNITSLVFNTGTTPNYNGGWQPAICSDSAGTISYLPFLSIGIPINTSYWDPFTFIVCNPNYTVVPAAVSITGGLAAPEAGLDFSMQIDPSAVPQKATNLSEQEVFVGIWYTLGIDNGDDISFPDAWNSTSEQFEDGFFYLMAWQEPDTPPSSLLNSTILASRARPIYAFAAAQFAHQYLTVPQTNTISGELLQTQQMLVVRQYPVWLIEIILILIVSGVVFIVLKRPHGVVPSDPGSIGSLATILAASPHLVRSVTYLQPSTPLQSVLTTGRWQTSPLRKRDTFGISETSGTSPKDYRDNQGRRTSSTPVEAPSHEPAVHERVPVTWWRPFGTRIVMLLICIMLPIVATIILEVLLHFSNTWDGLANVSSISAAHYLGTFIPALIMISLATLYESLDSAVKILQPYAILRKGRATPSRSVLSNPPKNSTPENLVAAAITRQWALLATTLAMFVAPLLTIAASSLYTTQEVPYNDAAQVQVSEWFSQPWLMLQPDGLNGFDAINSESITVPTMLVQLFGASYPTGTYDDLALPALDLVEGSLPLASTDEVSSTSMQATVPALRNSLSCFPTYAVGAPGNPADNVSINTGSADLTLGFYWNFNITSTPGCGSTLSVTNDMINQQVIVAKDGYFGQVGETIYVDTDVPFEFVYQCPWRTVTFGYASNNNVTSVSLLCNWPTIQKLDVNVTLTVPDLAVNVSTPPVPLESTAVHFANATFDPQQSNSLSSAWTPLFLDNFMTALINGTNGPAPEDFLNSTVLARGVEQLYSLMVAQYLNVQYRVPSNNTIPTINGTLTGLQRTRLVQNAITTHILAAFLLFLMLCAAAACTVIDTRRLLPRNPCTIAGTAALLVGSEMLSRDVIPEGAEWLSTAELKDRGVFEGYLFTMGFLKAQAENEESRFGIGLG